MAECASCGRPLPDEGAECAVCNAEDRDIVLEPHKIQGAIALVKIGVVALFLTIALFSAFASRWPQINDAIGPAILYIAGGIALIVVLKFLIGRSDERL